MEQPSGRKEKLMLAAGLALALGLAAAQHFSPAAAAFARGEDLRLALLSPAGDVMLVWHTGSASVNAVSFPPARRQGPSGYVRAAELAALTGAAEGAGREEVYYVSLSSAPDLLGLLEALSSWRGRPRLFFKAAAFTWRLRGEGRTNIPPFPLFVIFSELSRLNSSSFILTDSPRPAAEEIDAATEVERPLRVEIFNATGRRDLAARAARHLRAAGFDVLTVSYYGKIEKHSRLVAYGSDTSAARRLRAALGLGDREIVSRPQNRSVADAAAVLGADFQEGAAGGGPGR
jgi:hypothetical protein